jgi:hypothetical protein
MQQQHNQAVSDSQKLHEQTTTILTSEYTKFKEIRQNLEETTKHATTLNLVVSNWPSYFATAYNKLRAQKVVVENIEKTRNMTTDIKIKDALTNQLAKERVLETQLSQQEQEWQREGHKAHIETNNAVLHLDQVRENIQQTEQQIDPESTAVHQEEITEKLNLLGQMKTMGLEAQHSINAWHEFTQHLQQTTPNILQTTFEVNPESREEGTVESIK